MDTKKIDNGRDKMKSIFLALFLCSTALNAHASARDWNCWEEVDVTVCKNHQTGQIVRKSVDPSGVITYRDNYGQIVKAYQDQYGATRYRDAYNQEFDPFYEPPQPTRSYYQPPKKEKYTDNYGNKVTVIKEKDKTTYIDQDYNKIVKKRDVFGNLVYEYNDGEKVTIKKDWRGNTVYEYNDGYKITKEREIGGSYHYKDNKDNQINVKKDIFNNVIYEDQKGNTITKKKNENKFIFKDKYGNEITKEIKPNREVKYYFPNGKTKTCKIDFFGRETCDRF